jgi:6-pyruvoyltetrahydropterin/6-carboxytetrahydropterin synthase
MIVTRVERLEAVAPDGAGGLRVLAYDVEASVDEDVDPATGMVVNLADMKATLRADALAGLRGAPLDGTEGRPHCPTPELLARALWSRLGGRIAGRPLKRLRLVGHPSPCVDCYGEGDMDVTRTYEFSAAHRLHSAGLDEHENRRIFGKCNNPAGHGHNYVLEVTLRGEPGAGGEVMAGADLDRIVTGEIVDRWDHKNLNEDVEEFRGVNPTAEEIARIAWERILAALPASDGGPELFKIKLRETARNHVEYFGEGARA